jgi:threonine dehydrogenase-like Zn-dependent dehydrogenase
VAVKALAPRGRLVQMGAAPPSATVLVTPYDVFIKELAIIGSFSLAEKYAEGAERMVDLQSALSQLVTATFPLEDYAAAMAAAASADQIKVQITG